MNTTDLQLFSDGSTTMDPEAFAPAGVRGADKVVQRFLYYLLTPAGSVPGQPGRGTEFLDLIASFSSEFDIYTAFLASEGAAIASVQSCQDADDLNSEKIGAVRLSDVSISGDGLTITITIGTLDPTQAPQNIDFTLEA